MPSDESRVFSIWRSRESITLFAVAAVLTWIVAEIVLRWGLAQILVGVVESARGADMILLGIGIPLLAYGLAQWGMQRSIGAADWDYNISVRSVGSGLAGTFLYFLVIVGVTFGYIQIVGTAPSGSTSTTLTESVGETLWVAVLLFLVNGIVVPITEELAWRGVIQTAFMDSFGTYIGGTITALAFVLKHLIVDAAAPFLRVASLVTLAFILCGLRARYGTMSSTVAHLGANSIASALVVLAAL